MPGKCGIAVQQNGQNLRPINFRASFTENALARARLAMARARLRRARSLIMDWRSICRFLSRIASLEVRCVVIILL